MTEQELDALRPPEFHELIGDPLFQKLDTTGKVEELRRNRQNWRGYLDRKGKLADGEGVIDNEARWAAEQSGVELEPGFWAGSGQDFAKGVNQVRLAWNTFGQDDAEDIAGIAKYEREHPGSLASEDLTKDMSDGTGLLGAIKKNPAGFLSTTYHGALSSVPGSLASAGAGIGAGVATGVASANPLLGLAASATAAGATSQYMERAGRYLEKLREAGAPVEDGKALEAWIAENPERAEGLKVNAHVEALPTAGFDAAAAALPGVGVGARAARGVESKLAAKLIEGGIEQGMQGALGAAGSIGSNLVAGEEIDSMGALQEALGEVVNPLELLGPAGRLGRKAFRKSSPSPVETAKPNADHFVDASKMVDERAPAEAQPEAGWSTALPEDDDLLGTGDLERAMQEEARARERAERLAAINATPLKDKLDALGAALDRRADEARARGAEGDSVLSVVESELGRLRDAQDGAARQANLGDIAQRLRATFAGEQPEDFVDGLALDLHGANSASSRVAIDAALRTVRAARERAAVPDAPLRAERLAREEQQRKSEELKAELRAAETARLTAEHDAEIRRLDAARVTPQGEPDWNKFDDDELGAFAHGDEADPFLATIAEAQRLQDADPDLVEKPRGTLFNRWREEAARVFDKRIQEAERGDEEAVTLNDWLAKARIQIPDKSTHQGTLNALRQSFMGERTRPGLFKNVSTPEEGDRMLSAVIRRMQGEGDHSLEFDQIPEILDLLKRAAEGERIAVVASREDGVRFSRATQGTFEFGDGTRVGFSAPGVLRGLVPNWRDIALRFESALDKTVYYATSGATGPGAEAARASLAEAGLSEGQIAALGRALRERLATTVRAVAGSEPFPVPELLAAQVEKLTGVRFAHPNDLPPLDSAPQDHFVLRDDERAQALTRRVNAVLASDTGDERGVRADVVRREEDGREDLPTGGRAAEAFAAEFGREVVWYRTLNGRAASGFYHPATPNLIYLNADAPSPLLEVAGHEAWHALAAEHPELAREAQQALHAIARNFGGYQAQAIERGYRAWEVDEEFGAENAGQALLRPQFLERLSKEAPGAFEKFIGIVRGLLAKARAMFSRSAPLVKDIDKADAIVAKAFAEWKRRIEKNAPAPAPSGPGKAYSAELYRGVSREGRPNDAGAIGKGTYWTPSRRGAEGYARAGGTVLHERVELKNAYYATYTELRALQEDLVGDWITGFGENDDALSREFTGMMLERGYDGAVIYDPEVSATVPEEIVVFPKDWTDSLKFARAPKHSAKDHPGAGIAELKENKNSIGEKAGNKWKVIMPTFQGGKQKMAPFAGQLIRDTMSLPERQEVRVVHDWFGGGGSWGQHLALAHFPNVERVVIHEFEPARVQKIKLYAERGNSIEPAWKELAPALEQAGKQAFAEGKHSKAAVGARFLKLVPANLSADARALVQGVEDQLSSSFNSAKNEEGERDARESAKELRRLVTDNARLAFEGAQELRNRGVKLEFVTGDSYAAPIEEGKHVLSVFDPPYYKTKGYQESIVGIDTYRRTADRLRELAAAGNGVLYTDEAWWLKDEERAKRDPSGERELSLVLESLENPRIVKIADRHETLFFNRPGQSERGRESLRNHPQRPVGARASGLESGMDAGGYGDGGAASLPGLADTPEGEVRQVGRGGYQRAGAGAAVDARAAGSGAREVPGTGVSKAEAALAEAKAKRDALPNNPDDVNRRRANAAVVVARRNLTTARANESLPLAENEIEVAARRLGAAQEELSKLQAMGKRIGGEAYKNAPVYKQALAERDAAFAAVTALSTSAKPAAKADALAEKSAERERIFRELNEGQPSPEEQAAKQARLAELNREIKDAERGAEREVATDWSPENFDASVWASRILETDARTIPRRDHFSALTENQLGELALELKKSRDADNASRVDTVLTNLGMVKSNRNTRGAGAQSGPTRRDEVAAAVAEAKEVLRERDRRILERSEKIIERRRAALGDAADLLELPVQPEAAPKEVRPDEDFVPTDAFATVSEEGELEAVEPSEEDREALAQLDSVTESATPRNIRDDDLAARELAAQMERERNRKAGDGEPPKKTPGEVDGEPEYRDRGGDGPAGDVYGVTKATDPAWAQEKRDWKTFVRGFISAVPEIPRGATHLKGIVEGYKALSRGQEVAVHDAQEKVAHILEPIMKLEKPADPRNRKALAKVREREAQVRTRMEEALLDAAMPIEKKARLAAELGKRALELKKEAGALVETMKVEPLTVFENFILWRDLFHRAVSLKRDNGDDIALPFGVNPEEAQAEAEKWAERVKAHPESAAIREAIKRHEQEVVGNWEDFKKRHLPIEGVWNGGRAYFPHVLPEFTTGRPDRVAKGAGLDFRAYLQKPVGSVKAIETDYAKAMFLHVAAIKADNLHQDIVRRDFASLDATEDLEAEQAEIRRTSRSGRVPSIPALAASKGLVAFDPGDAMRHALAPVVSREAIGKALGRVLTDGPLAEQLEGLAKEGIRLTPEMFHEGLVQIESKPWYVPKEAAAALREIGKREESLPFDFPGSLGRLNRAWKKYQLFTPHNYLRYEFNNTVADTTKLAAVDPGAFKKMMPALKEVLAFYRGEAVDEDTVAAFRNGVFDTPTVRESEDIARLRDFDGKLMTGGEQAVEFLKKYLNGATYSKVREGMYRLAKYQADLERIRKGKTPVYAGAYWKDIEAIGESSKGAGDQAERRAAAISLATLNDVHAVSRSGQWLRRNLIPFYSFVENNFRYHLNLYRNMKDMVANGEMTRAEMAKLGAKSSAAFTARAAVGIASRLALPMVALALWNAKIGGDDELSEEDRRRLHINLGRDAEGRRRVMYLENDLMAILRWFGGNRAMGNAVDAVSGRTDFATAAKDWAAHVVPDFLNSAASFGPAVRVPVLAATGKQMFPDVTDMRTVYGKDKWYAVLSEMVGLQAGEWIRSATDADFLQTKTGWDQVGQMVAQIRLRDPESWAFYKMKDRANDWQEERTGRGEDKGAKSSPEMIAMRSFRRAIFRGDVEGALSMYDRLLKYGYTADRLSASVRSFDPLSAIPKGERKAFVDQLDEHEKKDLERAFLYAERYKFLGGNRAKALFPKDSENPAVKEARRAAFEGDAGRREKLREFIEQQKAQDEDQRRLDAELDRRASMRKGR